MHFKKDYFIIKNNFFIKSDKLKNPNVKAETFSALEATTGVTAESYANCLKVLSKNIQIRSFTFLFHIYEASHRMQEEIDDRT